VTDGVSRTDMTGRVVLITGANTGIGRATAMQLAEQGAELYLACRTAERTRPVVEEITEATGRKPHYLQLDLGDLESVRECAQTFLAERKPLHVLLNNAGVGGRRGSTASGFELAFGINHVGHFLLTELLRDKLVESAPARVVTVASTVHFNARGIDFEAVRKPTASRTGLPEYAVSKLANVLFTQELARRLEGTGVTTYAVHPGAVASDVWRGVPWPIRPLIKLFMRSTEEGAATSVYCATAPELATETGRYYDDCAAKEPSKYATRELAAELWRRSEEWVADYR